METTTRALNNALIGANIGKTKAETKAIAETIAQDWTKISQGWVNLSQGERNTKMNELKTRIDAQYHGIMDVAGRTIDDVLELIAEYRDWETDRKSTRLNSSHRSLSRMPSSA